MPSQVAGSAATHASPLAVIKLAQRSTVRLLLHVLLKCCRITAEASQEWQEWQECSAPVEVRPHFGRHKRKALGARQQQLALGRLQPQLLCSRVAARLAAFRVAGSFRVKHQPQRPARASHSGNPGRDARLVHLRVYDSGFREEDWADCDPTGRSPPLIGPLLQQGACARRGASAACACALGSQLKRSLRLSTGLTTRSLRLSTGLHGARSRGAAPRGQALRAPHVPCACQEEEPDELERPAEDRDVAQYLAREDRD